MKQMNEFQKMAKRFMKGLGVKDDDVEDAFRNLLYEVYSQGYEDGKNDYFVSPSEA